jgi:16S rRNA (adenine1518-N6/adenine1519-N6)-dimethyltransferase
MLDPMSISVPPADSGAEAKAGLVPEYDSPASLSRLLDREGLAMTKRFGQNFLVNRGARERILDELGAAAGEPVWEIGPGIGSMTAAALERDFQLTAFEIDHGFARLLERIFAGKPNFRLREGDFLATWKSETAEAGAPTAIFGNLPYSAAAAIIASLIEGGLIPRRMVFTVQKEVGLRMIAGPGTKDYSAFSVLCSAACKVRMAFDIGGGSFWPVPRVTSSVVVFEPRAKALLEGDRKGFSRFVRASFSSRRKTLWNNLRAAGYGEPAFLAATAELGIERTIRAEALAPETLARLYTRLARPAS